MGCRSFGLLFAVALSASLSARAAPPPVEAYGKLPAVEEVHLSPSGGRYAMIDDGIGFRLVPWRPVIEQRLGQQPAATMCSGGVGHQ